MTLKPQLTCLIHSTEVPNSGANKKIVATIKECREIAKILGVDSLLRLEAHFIVKRWRRDGLKITADISADVVQNCVVSLETVTSSLSEQAEWHFKPVLPLKNDMDVEAVLDIDPLGEDPADPLVEGKIDLGELMIEHLCLMIDPFVRSPSVDFDEVYSLVQKSSKLETSEASPFAILQEIGKTGKN